MREGPLVVGVGRGSAIRALGRPSGPVGKVGISNFGLLGGFSFSDDPVSIGVIVEPLMPCCPFACDETVAMEAVSEREVTEPGTVGPLSSVDLPPPGNRDG
jgi:hypothetical protein